MYNVIEQENADLKIKKTVQLGGFKDMIQ